MAVEKRFLKYVSYWTTSEDDQESIPSTKRQFELAKVLEQELKELNLEKVRLDEHCYVYGLLPATAGMEGKKAVGFIAHMDTAPDFSGENVKPQIIENYNGEDVLLPGSGTYIKVEDFQDETNKKIAMILYEEFEKGNSNINSIIDSLEEEEQNQITMIMSEDYEIKDIEKAIDDIIQSYEKEKLNNRKFEILEELEQNIETDKKRELEKELSDIIIRLAKIK